MAFIVVLPGEESDAFAEGLYELLRGKLVLSLISRLSYTPASKEGGHYLIAAQAGQRLLLGKGCILICFSSCTEAIPSQGAHLLLGEGLSIPQEIHAAQIISCGRGGKNTVTLSSLRADRAMLAVQRTLTTLDGHLIEPCEYPLMIPEGTALYEALAAAIILLLLGNEPEELLLHPPA